MTATHKNYLKTTISAVASSGLGAFTISTASSGYRTFGAGDDGKTFDGITISEGNDWEICDGCVYTHSGTSLSRGTRQDSSSGGAIAFTSAAVVEQNPSAAFGGRVEQVALVRVTGTDASITLAPNTHYTWDLSILTADRTGTLPTTAAVGDAIEISAIVGNASFELLLSTGSGQTCALRGTVVAASTEITRLFIAGESIRFVYEATNKWAVVVDGRVKASCKISRTTVQAITTGTNTKVQCATVVTDPFGMADTTTNYRITVRRAGNYAAEIFVAIGALDDRYRIVGRVYKNGVLDSSTPTMYMSMATALTGAAQGSFKLPAMAAGDYIELWVYWDGTTGTKDTGTGGNSCTLLVSEE